jgi:hypothetical protein
MLRWGCHFTDVFRSPLMPKPKPFRDRQDEEDFNAILDLRRDLMWRVPITSAQITICDGYLAQHPNTDIRDRIEIMYRNLLVQSYVFEDLKDEPVSRMKILFSIQRQLEQFLALPERIRECLGNPFWPWEEILAAEEEAEADQRPVVLSDDWRRF